VAETAIVVLVPELEPLVASWRRSLTQDGERGMPPHVTLLYPFVDEADVDAARPKVARVLASFAPFEASFAATARFPDTLYLAPEPPAPFVAMTEALAGAFPEYPPYGGAFDEVVPHVTVAHGDQERFASIEDELRPVLPVSVRIERAWLMSDGPDGWRREAPFPLDRR
jgi:2'-5' RNA ligase